MSTNIMLEANRSEQVTIYVVHDVKDHGGAVNAHVQRSASKFSRCCYGGGNLGLRIPTTLSYRTPRSPNSADPQIPTTLVIIKCPCSRTNLVVRSGKCGSRVCPLSTIL